jgi:diaminohydroxyphosphoribosylaminopyrimidine deaminase/5-amino-6-(5-phosphoribosylamino)uracil reductase
VSPSSANITLTEKDYLNLALKLARKGRFFTSPNPLCGAVLVKNGKIIGKGYHKRFGGPHAEILAIESVKERDLLPGSTLYSLLEPCSHYGKTPPCAERIIKEGIKEVVFAMEDPNPIIKGREVLEKAGIKVRSGIMEKEAKTINEWYIKYVKKKMPYVTLKSALTLDGKIATKKGESKWLTEKKARNFSNLLRCEQDAVLVGIRTILRDDPKLTCRRRRKFLKRVVLDKRLRIPLTCQLLKEKGEIIIFTRRNSRENEKRKRLEELGVKVIPVPEENGLLAWSEILRELYQLGCAKVLIEGGAEVFSSALQAGIVDRVFLFLAPKILGEGLSFTEKLSLGSLKEAIKLKEGKIKRIGEDFLFTAYVHRYY